jgi:hypothetical protein
MDPYHFERKDREQHQSDELEPDPHQSDKLHLDPHLFADDKLKSRFMAYEHMSTFQGFKSFFGS